MAWPSDKTAAYESIPLSAFDIPKAINTPSKNMIERPRESRYLVKAWRWEAFTFLLGTGAFTAILGLLLSFQNKPASEVNFRIGASDIQITAVIAALAQVAQSALMVPISYCIGQLKWEWFQKSNCTADLDRFDLASRGPDGSVRLLWHFSWRQRLVSIGALSTILMLVFPTFVQQSVQEGDIDAVEYSSSKATMSRAISVVESTAEDIMLYTVQDIPQLVSSQEVNTALIDALRNGIAHDNPIDPLGIWQVPSDSANGLSGSCLPSIDEQCSWDAFKTLALCYSREDVTHHIILEDDDVSLSAFSGFHQKFERYAAFRSRVHGYTNGTGTTVFPATSVSNGTNLPNLAEIYYLFYDPCADPNAFNKSNITHWKAYKGTFQFCIQTLNASKVSTSNNGATTMTLINSRVDLNWNATTRDGGSTFCTIVNGEETEFCVSEPLMKKLAIHINRIFNATADFSESDHSNDIYNTEWGPLLIKQLYKYCGDSHSAFIWGFQDTLEGVTHSLTNKFRTDVNGSDIVYGTYTYAQRVVLVDFRWLILPAALWVMIAILLISTVVTTRDTPMWKSSPLPLLYMMRLGDTPMSEDIIRRGAKQTCMELKRTKSGWQMLDTTAEIDMSQKEEGEKRRVAE